MEDVECPTDELRQMQREERRRLDYWLMQFASAQARTDQRLMAIEAMLASTLGQQQAWTTSEWLKILTGIGLPLAVLLLTRDVELARRFVAP